MKSIVSLLLYAIIILVYGSHPTDNAVWYIYAAWFVGYWKDYYKIPSSWE